MAGRHARPRQVKPDPGPAVLDALTEPLLLRDWFEPGVRHRKVVAIIPARNEAASIRKTVKALQEQDRVPDRILVVANNCTDETAGIARDAGAEVIEMPDNPHRKAGAINQGLNLVLPELEDRDMVMIQDADTLVNREFLTAAAAAMEDDVGGVCARYDNPAPRSLIERLQSSEFARSRRATSRRGGTTRILVGIASLFTVGTLRKVIAARKAGILPGSPAVYSNASLTEDYELTLALRTLGYRLICPPACRPLTHAMPTFRKLWDQRVRWSRGGLDDLYVYGVTKVTRPYVFAQVGRIIAMMSPFLYGSYLLALYLTYGHIAWSKPWILINVLFIAERIITVREEGWRAMLLSAFLIPELLYDWFLAATYLTGLAKHLRGSTAQWAET